MVWGILASMNNHLQPIQKLGTQGLLQQLHACVLVHLLICMRIKRSRENLHSNWGEPERAPPSQFNGCAVYLFIYIISRGQPHPKYKANSARTSHIAVWERDARWPQSLGMTGDELHDGAEVQLTGMAPEVRNQNTVLVQFEA